MHWTIAYNARYQGYSVTKTDIFCHNRVFNLVGAHTGDKKICDFITVYANWWGRYREHKGTNPGLGCQRRLSRELMILLNL